MCNVSVCLLLRICRALGPAGTLKPENLFIWAGVRSITGFRDEQPFTLTLMRCSAQPADLICMLLGNRRTWKKHDLTEEIMWTFTQKDISRPWASIAETSCCEVTVLTACASLSCQPFWQKKKQNKPQSRNSVFLRVPEFHEKLCLFS